MFQTDDLDNSVFEPWLADPVCTEPLSSDGETDGDTDGRENRSGRDCSSDGEQCPGCIWGESYCRSNYKHCVEEFAYNGQTRRGHNAWRDSKETHPNTLRGHQKGKRNGSDYFPNTGTRCHLGSPDSEGNSPDDGDDDRHGNHVGLGHGGETDGVTDTDEALNGNIEGEEDIYRWLKGHGEGSVESPARPRDVWSVLGIGDTEDTEDTRDTREIPGQDIPPDSLEFIPSPERPTSLSCDDLGLPRARPHTVYNPGYLQPYRPGTQGTQSPRRPQSYPSPGPRRVRHPAGSPAPPPFPPGQAPQSRMERERWYLESRARHMSDKYELVVFAMAMARNANDNDHSLENIVNNNHITLDNQQLEELDNGHHDMGSLGNGNHNNHHQGNDVVEKWWEQNLDQLMEGVSYSDVCKSYEDKAKDINSPDSNDSGIQADVQHIHGPVNEDIYAVVNNKNRKAVKGRKEAQKQEEPKGEDKEDLPPGWERHEDEDGPYYWHIKSGTIQRDPPPPPPPDFKETKRSTSTSSQSSTKSDEASSSTDTSTPEPSGEQTTNQPDVLTATEGQAVDPPAEKSRECRDKAKQEGLPIRFAVRSLGWVKIAEEDLTPERSSKAVNKCIVDLSLGRNEYNDVVGRWGDGKDLFMDLDHQNLTLTDPQDLSVLNIQPIHSIRVWGVGRDNGRDFAYVARDRMTRIHMCHVFRCDTPARQIANTLRDICKKIMMARSLREGMAHNSSSMQKMGISRPNNLPNLIKDGQANGQKLTFEQLCESTSFPTPMEEPKKVLRCHYLGTAQVPRPTGVETLNSAMEKVYSRVPPEKWVFVSVAVAPSTITITEHGKPDNVLAECRVRFLSFMGIAMRNVKLCAYIMHTAQDHYVAHVFHCEPSAGAVCKTIEAACKLRFQKCLDANTNQQPDRKASSQCKGLGASIKHGVQSVFGSIAKGRNKTKS